MVDSRVIPTLPRFPYFLFPVSLYGPWVYRPDDSSAWPNAPRRRPQSHHSIIPTNPTKPSVAHFYVPRVVQWTLRTELRCVILGTSELHGDSQEVVSIALTLRFAIQAPSEGSERPAPKQPGL